MNDKIQDQAANSDSYIFWDNPTEQTTSLLTKQMSDNISSYDGVLTSTASNRAFLNIEPNISVRDAYSQKGYYSFRPDEDPNGQIKRIISKCMCAYDKVGIIKNVIDLMGDFASQGISINHPNKRIERFYRRWWTKINGTERSERFLNILYRCGNVVVHRRTGKITRKTQKEMSAKGGIAKREIPLRYNFLNPLSLEVIDGHSAILDDKPRYAISISEALKKSILGRSNSNEAPLPNELLQNIQAGKSLIEIDPDQIETFFYKKDDWQIWANPMINAILDDISMLEKMKLADMSALDGAISNIRLWRLGSLEHKIMPNAAAINRLRDVLASNVGGGTMDLVWGPELDFKESNTQIYKFLGSEKYGPVLNSIYAGLGIPPTLTGLAGQSGGYTNNFISLKTLIERLEYGRSLLKKFWMDEIYRVQQAMGFSEPASLHFDFMILSDETAEKNLLLQLADRDIISIETLRDRLGEDDKIENSRIKNEFKERDSGKRTVKVDPYHTDPEIEYTKIALQKDNISIEDVTDLKHNPTVTPDDTAVDPNKKKKPSIDKGGRPQFKKDQTKRKQKAVLPRTKPGIANLMIWATEAQKKIADTIHPLLLDFYKKKSLRELSKSEASTMETIKFHVLCAMKPFSSVDKTSIDKVLSSGIKKDAAKANILDGLMNDFVNKNGRSPSTDELRQMHGISYSLSFLDEDNV